MAKTHTRPWDPAEHLQTEEDVAAYLQAAAEEGDPDLMAAALDDVTRAAALRETPEGKAEPGGVVGSYIREEPKGTKGGYDSRPSAAVEQPESEDEVDSGV